MMEDKHSGAMPLLSRAAMAWSHVSRRMFLGSAAGVLAAFSASARLRAATRDYAAQASVVEDPVAPVAESNQAMPMTLQINGRRYDFLAEPRVTLLDALRENLSLTGTKKGCDRGQCGACTVLVDGRRINSCLTLAVMHQDQQITSVEGLAQGDSAQPHLHPLQAAFIEHDAFQCGYCTPGQLCSAVGAIQEMRAGMPSAVTENLQARIIKFSKAEISERMSGNLCRCGAYTNIVEAVQSVLVSPV
jgi:xanthine dehydrogenase YagT iron-sulfur-binding subunit